MTQLFTVISTVADGSMYNRHNSTDPAVIENRRVFLEKHGLSIDQTTRLDTQLTPRAINHDTNFHRYFEVNEDAKGAGMYNDDVVTADAIVTTHPGHVLLLPVADCVGAVLYAATQGVLMMSHLGRHSLEQQGAQKSVEYLTEHYGANPEDVEVWLTPAAGKDKYPIWALDNKGMKEATLEQLAAAGITEAHIHDSPENTTDDENYYSYSEYLKGNRNEDGDHLIVAVMQ
ncbi:MAG: laccase domain-containing protein [Candidatus Microsaccharimonas sp.]